MQLDRSLMSVSVLWIYAQPPHPHSYAAPYPIQSLRSKSKPRRTPAHRTRALSCRVLLLTSPSLPRPTAVLH